MNSYIFITTEGITFQPGSESAEPDVENMQVLGFGRGNTAGEALETFSRDNMHLVAMAFDEVIAFELKSETKAYFSLSSVFNRS